MKKFSNLVFVFAVLSRLATAETEPALKKLNLALLSFYDNARAKRIATTSPVVIDLGDRIILLRDGKREEQPLLPQTAYHSLKAISHVVLGVFGALKSECTDPKTSAKTAVAPLSDLLPLLDAAEGSAGAQHFSEQQQKRKSWLFARTRDVLGEAVSQLQKTGSFSCELAERFVNQVRPSVLLNVSEAGEINIRQLHLQMTSWMADWSAAEATSFHVVVSGSHMARSGSLSLQYFEWLVGENDEGHRVVFAEGITDEAGARELLAIHLVDAQLSRYFYSDPKRMHRDVLGDAGGQAIRSLSRPKTLPK